MINKEILVKFIQEYKKFSDYVDKIEEMIFGKHHYVTLWETPFCESVGNMYDLFIKSYFTEEGQDLINWFIFEDVEKIIYEPDDDIYSKEKREIHLDTIDDLWNYMIENKSLYFNEPD
jgi:hypothetical protein